ncbi:MAG: hypothetical protein HXX10_23335 [Rhodoplanes sp.]|uniref:hypothetical protein n=1 Tax=Rhodoplanes sp. TaxID=1968906 RepID=UPI001830D6B9|nr:hypothetical protein [Rhodoplanes sp.]NVO16970.1 hypothetical protein [Rhodoplanes sp.]
MGIVSSQFNWVSTRSSYDQVTNWRTRQRAYNTQAETNLATVSDVFSSSSHNLSGGLAEIAAKRAAARVQAEAQAKVAKAQLDTSV